MYFHVFWHGVSLTIRGVCVAKLDGMINAEEIDVQLSYSIIGSKMKCIRNIRLDD